MPATPELITVDPNGFTVSVDIKDVYAVSQTTYTASGGASTHTLPLSISTPTAFYLTAPGVYTVSATLAGVSVMSQAVECRGGVPVVVKLPAPSLTVLQSLLADRVEVLSAPSTYTLTYSTANRTVAAPTAAAVVTLTDSTGLDGSHNDTLAATTVPTTLTDSSGYSGTHDDTLAATTVPGALTVTDGAGTNDGTIGAITDNASTIAAVQELAAKVNAILTLLAVMAQNDSDLAQKVIEHNALLGVIAQNDSDLAQKVIELVAEHTKIVADDLDNRQSVVALAGDLITAGVAVAP